MQNEELDIAVRVAGILNALRLYTHTNIHITKQKNKGHIYNALLLHVMSQKKKSMRFHQWVCSIITSACEKVMRRTKHLLFHQR